MTLRRICVYCASSRSCDRTYLDAAHRLGVLLAQAGLGIIYGGGAAGLMGALAEGALAHCGSVTGIIPRFMMEQEWGHAGITDLEVVDDMHRRKYRMIQRADAFVALPGGTGTFEELFEALTWKRLGLHRCPVVIANLNGFYDPCLALLERAIDERFMNPRHADLWAVADTIEDVLPRLRDAPPWPDQAIDFAGA